MMRLSACGAVVSRGRFFSTFTGYSHLVQHLNTVLTEAVVVVWGPCSPVGERRHVFVRPSVPTRYGEVVQSGPHAAGGCRNTNILLTSVRQNMKCTVCLLHQCNLICKNMTQTIFNGVTPLNVIHGSHLEVILRVALHLLPTLWLLFHSTSCFFKYLPVYR